MTLDSRRALVLLASVIAIVLVLPRAAGAQGQSFGRVNAQVEERYESNLFATPESGDAVSDWITRFGPSLDAGYQSVSTKLQVHGGFEAEHYQSMPNLNEAFAQQDYSSTLNYQARLFTVDVNGSYTKTRTPSDLNLETLLFVGRSPAKRADGSAAIAFTLSPVSRLAVDQQLTRDSIVGGVTSTSRITHVAFSRKVNPRSTLRSDYRLGRIDFSTGGDELSHVLTGGVLHQISPALEVEANAGIRSTSGPTLGSTSGDLDPEISAQVRRRMRQGEAAVRYERTRETTIGVGESLQVQRLSADLLYKPTRTLSFRVTPARAKSGGTLSDDTVTRVDVETQVKATRRWTVLATGRFGRQETTFGTGGVIPYQSISLKTVVTMGTLEREEDAETETP